MKKKILSTLLATGLLMTAGTAVAGGKDCKNGHFGQHKGGMRIYKKLDLNKDQKQQIKAIFKAMRPDHKSDEFKKRQEHMQARKEVIQSDTLDETALNNLANEMAEKVKQRFIQRAKAEHKIWLLLTPEQREKLLEKQNKHRKKMQDKFEKRMKKHTEKLDD